MRRTARQEVHISMTEMFDIFSSRGHPLDELHENNNVNATKITRERERKR